ncbi:trichohyalin-like [Onthophagus taurus]|uniref:trichohyalin-like n=1 Tax=Onthophagus taurus TaxID=166361 RepID=UPI0039BDF0A8
MDNKKLASEKDREEGKVDPPATDRPERRPKQHNVSYEVIEREMEERVMGKSTKTARTPPRVESQSKSSTDTSNGEDESEEELDKTIIEKSEESKAGEKKEHVRLCTEVIDLERDTPQRIRSWSIDSGTMKRRRVDSEEEELEREESYNEQAKTVKKGIENIMKMIKILKQNEEQNTKREIKKAVQMLERQADIFNRKDTKQWIQEMGEGRVKCKRKEVKEMSTQTETEEEIRERSQEMIEEQEINRAVTYEEWKRLVNKKWKRRYYNRTAVKEGNPLWQQQVTTRVVVVEPEDENMTRSIQSQFKMAYPGLEELNEKYEEIERTTKTKIRGKEIERNEKVIKLTVEKTDLSVWKAMSELKERNKKEKKIAIHHIRQMTLSKFRKMLEIVFKGTDIEMELYTTRAKIEEENEEKTQNERKTYAIIVERPGKTYEETVRGIKQRLQGRVEVDKIEGIRSTKDGKVLITTQKDKEAVMEIQKVLREEDGQRVTDRGIEERKQTKTIHIRGLMITTEENEIIQAINRDTGCEKNEIKMSSLRPYAESMMAVTIELAEEKAKKLMNSKRIRIGLAMCSVEERVNIKKCLKCWSPQHLIKDCTGPDRRNCCYNCGVEGHLTKECTNQTRCPDCEKKGHRAASMRCEMYRAQIKDGKREKRNRQEKECGEEETKDEKTEERGKQNKKGNQEDVEEEIRENKERETREMRKREEQGNRGRNEVNKTSKSKWIA